MGKSFSSFGDLGDIIYLCPSMKLVAQQTGSPVILYARNGLREHDPITERLESIRRLLESQDYIGEVCAWDGEPIDYDSCHFRRQGHPFAVTLLELQARFVGLLPDPSQRWLFAEPALASKGKIIIARSARYHNPYFPWKELMRSYSDRMVFVGHPAEHAIFCREFGPVTCLPTSDLYEVAALIAGSAQFIGNQSSPYAIAEGLKHPSIQETNLESPDCLFPRPNARHCFDGGLDLNLFGRFMHTTPVDLRPRAGLNETPPGGWRVSVDGHSARSYSFDMVVREIRLKLRGKAPDNLLEMVIEQSSVDMPPSPPEYSIRQLRQLLF
jgi:hypothetical protein